MPLWSNTDANTSAPKYAVSGGLGLAETGAELYNNPTTLSDGVTTIDLMGVDATEQGVSGNPKGGHAGWISVKTGSGGRSGRVQIETLVAMGSMTGDGGEDPDSDGGPDANDDITFADA